MTFRFFYRAKKSYRRMLYVLIALCFSLTGNSQISPTPDSQKDYYVKSVFFGGGSYYIDSDQRKEVVDFILDIDDLREYQIVVHGHTDNIGSLDFNQWLSEMRSAEVLDILSELSLDGYGIDVHDFGEESPYYSNQTWEGKLSNRRVDIIIQKIPM